MFGAYYDSPRPTSCRLEPPGRGAIRGWSEACSRCRSRQDGSAAETLLCRPGRIPCRPLPGRTDRSHSRAGRAVVRSGRTCVGSGAALSCRRFPRSHRRLPPRADECRPPRRAWSGLVHAHARRDGCTSFAGTGPIRSGRIRRIPRGLQFTKLRIIPDQMYFDVASVRDVRRCPVDDSADGLLRVERHRGHARSNARPDRRLHQRPGADVIDFAASLSFEQFKERTESLNDLATYSQIGSGPSESGTRSTRWSIAAITPATACRRCTSRAIASGGEIAQRQAQELADMKLRCEGQRGVIRRARWNRPTSSTRTGWPK